jgi:hypothetical protein
MRSFWTTANHQPTFQQQLATAFTPSWGVRQENGCNSNQQRAKALDSQRDSPLRITLCKVASISDPIRQAVTNCNGSALDTDHNATGCWD